MNILNQVLTFLLKNVYPPCCLICGKQSNKNTCKDCEEKLNKETKYIVVSKMINNDLIDKFIYIFEYKNIIRKLIIDYKFNDKAYLYKLFSDFVIKNKKIYGILKSYDIIIPVPIHKKRKRERGYNQSELIAKEISFNIDNLMYENKAIIKVKNNKRQSTLNKNERIQNIKNVYKVIDKERIKNKNIIVFDDIYTTGNTVKEISRILKENGANKVLVLTLAKD